MWFNKLLHHTYDRQLGLERKQCPKMISANAFKKLEISFGEKQ